MSLHKQLLEKWNLSEFGVKTRVFTEYTQQTIDYILKTPTYRDKEKMKSLIECIERKSKEVLDEVIEMTDNIKNIEINE